MSTQSLNQEWFNYPGVKENYRTMVYYPGTGDSTFEFNFEGGYINKEDIKAFMVKDDDREAKYLSLTFKGPNTVQTSEPVPVGWTVCIFRDTPKAEPLAKYQDGAVITAENLDRNAQQAMFAVSEMVDRFDSTVSQVEVALKEVYKATQVADEALAESKKATGIAQGAVATADSAKATANAATATANTASQRAEQAVQTANEAKNTANALDEQIKSANATAQAANQTAGDAKRIAEGIDGKATQAQSDAAGAVKTATEAKQIASSIDAKATQAQKDAAEALKKASEVEASVGTVQELSKRVESFPDSSTVMWKGAGRFKYNVQVRGDSPSLSAIEHNDTAENVRLSHRSGSTNGAWGFIDVGPHKLTYNNMNIHYNGYPNPQWKGSAEVHAEVYPLLSLQDRTRGNIGQLVLDLDGRPYLEWGVGAGKQQVKVPQSGGVLATETWSMASIGIDDNLKETHVRARAPYGTPTSALVVGPDRMSYWSHGQQRSLFTLNSARTLGGIESTHYERTNERYCTLIKYNLGPGGVGHGGIEWGGTEDGHLANITFWHDFNGVRQANWTIPFSEGFGTTASREWVNSQGFVKSAGTQLGPLVTGNQVPLHQVDSKAMKSEAFEGIMGQVPWGAVFCGVTFSNIGSIRSGAPMWREVY